MGLLGQRNAGGGTVGLGQNGREATNVKRHRTNETRRRHRIILLLFERLLEEHESEMFGKNQKKHIYRLEGQGQFVGSG